MDHMCISGTLSSVIFLFPILGVSDGSMPINWSVVSSAGNAPLRRLLQILQSAFLVRNFFLSCDTRDMLHWYSFFI